MVLKKKGNRTGYNITEQIMNLIIICKTTRNICRNFLPFRVDPVWKRKQNTLTEFPSFTVYWLSLAFKFAFRRRSASDSLLFLVLLRNCRNASNCVMIKIIIFLIYLHSGGEPVFSLDFGSRLEGISFRKKNETASFYKW